jgi:hypothetical protein
MVRTSTLLIAAAAVAGCIVTTPALAGTGLSADDPVITPFSNLITFSSEVYNDRIGNSRLFNGPNTDRVRISTRVYPSRDTDTFAVFNQMDGLWYQSTNGATTTVTLSHGSMGTLPDPQPLTFVGVTSGLGGGRSEFTTSYNRAAAAVAARLPDWDATPFQLTASNPLMGSGTTSVTYAAPDYDRFAMPSFVTDVKLTGDGVHPRLDWVVPGGTTPTAVTIQVRRIDAESADRTHITQATIVHVASLPATASSYSFTDLFSNASLAGFPTGLEFGQRYEIALQLDVSSGGVLKGRSRTFFELAPLADGGNEVAVYLPSAGTDGRFKFDVAVLQGQSIAIDPELAVGYDYAIGSGDPQFRSVKLPDVGDGHYDLWLWNGDSFSLQSDLDAGTEYFFDGLGVDRFRITGIETTAGLNPSDPTAFVTTLSFAGNGRFTGTMTALTVTVVPEPSRVALTLAGGLLLALRLRRWPARGSPLLSLSCART